MVVADVELAHRGLQRRHHFGVAVSQVVGAPVEVHIDEPPAIHVPQQVALAAVDDKVDPRVHPELGLVRVPVLLGLGNNLILGVEAEQVVLVHRSPIAVEP